MTRRARAPIRTIRIPASSRVSVVVRGFAAHPFVSAEQIASAIRWLPAYHVEGLREIVYSPREPLHYPSLGVPSASRGHAEFVQNERTIFVYRTDDVALFWHVLYHEIGHHVFFVVLGSTLKKRWVMDIYPGSECATAYGYTSAAEDFAECYALYAQQTRSLVAMPAKLGFMREGVFSDRPPGLREKSG